MPPNHTVKAFCPCSRPSRRLQYALMFWRAILRTVAGIRNRQRALRRIGVALLGLGVSIGLAVSLLRAQSVKPPEVRDTVSASSTTGTARQAYEQGQRAESTGDWEAA